MEKQQIIDYVMHTPYNTNPNILKGMLNEISTDKINDRTVIYNGTLTTETIYSGMDGYSCNAIIPSKITIGSKEAINIYVTFNGQDYVLPKSSESVRNGHYFYGTDKRYSNNDPLIDEAECPCGIISGYQGQVQDCLYTNTPGTYTIKIEI